MVDLPESLGAFSRTGPMWSPRMVHELEIDKISPDPENVRKTFDQTALEELAESLKSRGLLQPITVTRPDKAGRATIRHGERRWRAAKIAGFDKIRIVIDESEDASSRSLDQYVENEQREGLSPSEVVAFVRERLDTGMKAAALAAAIGKPKGDISKLAALGGAPGYLRERLDDLGMNTAYVLLQCDKQDSERTRQRLDEAGGAITNREARAFQVELKDRAANRDDDGAGPRAGVSADEVSEPASSPSAPSSRTKSAQAGSEPSSGASVTNRDGGERVLANYPALEVQGRSGRFISGMVVFDGELEARFVDLEG